MPSITTSHIVAVIGILALAIGLSSIMRPLGPAEPTAQTDTVVATVGSRTITLREVEQAAALPLYQTELQRIQLLQQSVQRMIDEQLLAEEASNRGVSIPQLLDEASRSESIAKLANIPAPVKLSSQGLSISQDLQREARIRQALLVSLRRKANIHVSLPAASLPVLRVSSDDDPAFGSDNAPITIVEFSDFQCPYCQRSVGILKELRRSYGDKIRVVYRDYPGPNHPYAEPAAEAAQCAGEQGKFWEYHDALFARQEAGQGWNFPALAAELGLQREAFDACLKSGRFREEVANDLRDGVALGITSTPTFFINGRPLVGAHPLTAFQHIIDTLLSQQTRS